MKTPLLKTKLSMPLVQSKLVARSRLIEQFKLGLQHRLTIVCAPAGYGKTTLLSEGVRNRQMPVGWVSLDEGDNDPNRFWKYFVTALPTIRVAIGKSILGLLQSPQPPSTESILTAVINEITEVNKEFTLVLDDYHMIEAPPIHDALTFLLNHLPSQMHLVIASRVDPPIPLARLRARAQLAEIRVADLRFTFEEATAFLNGIMGLGLSNADVTALESRTEGWIASLQLAAVSMQGRKDIPGFVATFSGSNRYILDFLVEEVLRRQETSVQSFLLETSVLDRFCAPLCDAVTGGDAGGEILAQLETANLFLVHLDDTQQWYRYHHLFADLLRNQLLRSQSERVTELHLRASNWFEHQGLTGEAIHHALAAEDYERSGNLIEAAAMTMVTQSNCATLLRWLERLSKVSVLQPPSVLMALFTSARMTVFSTRYPRMDL